MNLKVKEFLFGTNWLTKRERLVLCSVIGLLLVGLAVKTYRAAHPVQTETIEEVTN